MASQLFCLALLAVSAFGYDLTTRQQSLPYQSNGLYNQMPTSFWQGQVPYTNYIRQKQAYYLPYLAQKMQFIPAQAQQYIAQQTVPSGVEGQVNSPLIHQLLNREQVPQGSQKVVVSHEKQDKHSKKDKHSVVSQVPLNQARQEEQQESLVNYRGLVNEREVLLNQENNLPYQVKDINLPVQGLVQPVLGANEANQLVNLPAQGLVQPVLGFNQGNQQMNLPFQGLVQPVLGVNDANQQVNLPVQGLVQPVIGANEANQLVNLPVQGLVQPVLGVNQANQRVNLPFQGLVQPVLGVNDVNQQVNLPVHGLVRPSLEVSQLTQRMPFVQTNVDGSLGYTDILAPRYQAIWPVSQVYPARQGLLSLLRPNRPAIQVSVDSVRGYPTQQVREEFLQ